MNLRIKFLNKEKGKNIFIYKLVRELQCQLSFPLGQVIGSLKVV